MTWQVYKKKQAVGSKCAECCKLAEAFPNQAWAELVADAVLKPEVREQLQFARKVLRGEKQVSWLPQELFTAHELEMRVKRDLIFIPASSVKVEPSKLQMPLCHLPDENGTLIAGWFVQDDDSKKLKVEVSWRVSSKLNTTIMKPDMQIHQAQGMDTMKWAASKTFNQIPGKLFTMKDFEAKLEALAAPVQPPPADAQGGGEKAGTANAPLQEQGNPGIALHDDDGGHSEDEEEEAPQQDLSALLASAAGPEQPLGQGKGKQRKLKDRPASGKRPPANSLAMLKATKTKVSKPSLAAASEVSLPCASAASVGRSRSPRTWRGKAGAERNSVVGSEGTAAASDHNRDQSHRYQKALQFEAILSGGSLGNELAFAKRTLVALNNELGEGNAESVQLQAHIDLAEVCQKVSTRSICKLASEDRCQELAKIAPHLTAIPNLWAAKVTQLCAKDEVKKLVVDKPTMLAWMAKVWPTKPRFADGPGLPYMCRKKQDRQRPEEPLLLSLSSETHFHKAAR